MTHRAARYFGAFFPLFLLLSGAAQAAWTYEKTEGSTLQFVDSATKKTQKLKTSLKGVQFHAVLANPSNGAAYALYGGQACDHCGEQMALYLARIDGSGNPFQFVYPGTIHDPKRGTVFQARAFYGHCLPGVPVGYVSHQAEVVDRRRGLQKSVLVAEPGPEKVDDRLIEARLPSVKTTLDLVKRKECTEIAGRNRNVMRKNLGPGVPKSVLEDDDDEDEDKEDAKQAVTPATPDDPVPSPPPAPSESPSPKASPSGL